MYHSRSETKKKSVTALAGSQTPCCSSVVVLAVPAPVAASEIAASINTAQG